MTYGTPKELIQRNYYRPPSNLIISEVMETAYLREEVRADPHNVCYIER